MSDEILIQIIVGSPSPWKLGTVEGISGPEITHGSKSPCSNKGDKNLTQTKSCLR